DLKSRHIKLASIDMYNKLIDIFVSISKMYNKDITYPQFIKLFNLCIDEISSKTIEPLKDEVSLKDINISKIINTKVIYILGANDGKIPNEIKDDNIISDNDLKKIDIFLKEDINSKENIQLFNIYDIINKVEDKLYISVLSSDVDGKSLMYSSIIEDIKNVLDIQVIGNVTKEDNKIYCRDDVFNILADKLNNNDNITLEMYAMYKYLIKNTKLADIFSFKLETLVKAKNTDIITSVSKLEQYKKCPFSYFLKYELKLKKNNEYKVSSMDTGNFLHSVIEKISKYLFENNIEWKNYENYINILNDIVESELKNVFYKFTDTKRFIIIKRKLNNTIKKVISVIAKSYTNSIFTPVGYEVEFSVNKDLKPFVLKLNNDKYMYLEGKIDRIDTAVINSKHYTRVIDYKSSMKDLKLSDILDSISLQLITYLSIAKQDSLPASMLYFNLSDNIINLKDYNQLDKIQDNLRLKGIFLKDITVINAQDFDFNTEDKMLDLNYKSVISEKENSRLLKEEEFNNLCVEIKSILTNIGNEINSGNYSIKPTKDACTYCDYKTVCRRK
ncbi:MAG: PD-(D/E)XK nuclease family protein, partial [Clostridia bacterium]